MRLFVAVFPPAEAIAHLSAALQPLSVVKAGARVSASQRWHITLAFLGEVPDTAPVGAEQALNAVSLPSFQLSVRGGGRFGRGPGTVLWAGIDGDLDRLAQLARAVRRELRERRLRPDDKQFRPHLTLARPGNRVSAEALAGDLALLREYAGPVWPVEELVLVRSELGPNPSYHWLTTRSLTESPAPTGPNS